MRLGGKKKKVCVILRNVDESLCNISLRLYCLKISFYPDSRPNPSTLVILPMYNQTFFNFKAHIDLIMPAIDETDFKILLALSENSRVSLKKLAQSLRLKTNRLQYRIEKLVEQGLISSYTSVINPNSVGLKKLTLTRIISSSRGRTKSSKMSPKLLEDLASMILADFDEIMFASVGFDKILNESVLLVIFAFYDTEHQKAVFDAIKENPLVASIEATDLTSSNINHRLYTITPELLNKKDVSRRKDIISAQKEHQKHVLDDEPEENEVSESEMDENGDGLDEDELNYSFDSEDDSDELVEF